MFLRLRKIHRRIKDAYNEIRITYMYAKDGVKFRPPTEREKQLVMSAHDLVEADLLISFDARQEDWVVRAFPDGDFEVKYTYNYEDEKSLVRFLIITRVEIAKDTLSAEALFHDGISALETGAHTAGSRFLCADSLLGWSEKAYSALILTKKNEAITGCVLSFQKERLVYTIILSGAAFKSAEQVEQIVYPYLDLALAWSRKNT